MTDQTMKENFVASMSEKVEVIRIICKLVAYLVANIVRDEREWDEWGLPFIIMIVNAQTIDERHKADIFEEMNTKFCPISGHGVSFIIEEGHRATGKRDSVDSGEDCISSDRREDEDFTFVHTAAEFLTSIIERVELNGLSKRDNVLSGTERTEESDPDAAPSDGTAAGGGRSCAHLPRIELHMKDFISDFFNFLLKNDKYDARTRTIARRMCSALQVSAYEFQELESTHWKLVQRSDEADGDAGRYFDNFNRDKASVPAASLLASFRMWRVAFIAAGGGALMGVTGRLAAPSIIGTLMPLICASNSLGQVALTISTALSCFGLTSAEVIPGIMTAYGAFVAGQSMLHRTAPIKEFALEPLHVPVIVDDVSKDPPIDAADSSSVPIEEDPLLVQGSNATSYSCADDVIGAGTNSIGAPVYILVSGHKKSSVDVRYLWGANGISYTSLQPHHILPHAQLQDPEHCGDIGVIDKVAEDVKAFGNELEDVIEEEVQAQSSLYMTLYDRFLHAMRGFSATALPENGEGERSPKQFKSNDDDVAADAPDVVAPSPAAVDYKLDASPQEANISEGGLNKDRSDADLFADVELENGWQELVDIPRNCGWWRECASPGDDYILNWEPAVLSNLHDSLQEMVLDDVLGHIKGMVKGEILKFTPIPAIQSAASLPMMVLGRLKQLDDPWVVAMDRARQGGLLLAKILIAEQKQHLLGSHNNTDFESQLAPSVGVINASIGGVPHVGIARREGKSTMRPISLVGYGMGARLIFHCLEALAAEASSQQGRGTKDGVVIGRGIIENAVLIGTPVGTHFYKWAAARSVVAGRLINCYASNDWLLALLYRSKSYDVGVAGLYPVGVSHSKLRDGSVCESYASTEKGITNDEWKTAYQEAEVENIDVTHLVHSHSDYPNALPSIMRMLDLH